MLVLRVASTGSQQWVRTVWTWSDAVERLRAADPHTFVKRRDGALDRHRRAEGGWRVDRVAGTTRRTIELGGLWRGSNPIPLRTEESRPPQTVSPGVPIAFELGADSYRRSEESWEEAGRPSARVGVLLAPNELVVDVSVNKSGELTFVPDVAMNPFDNEAPDINGDGVQLYFTDASGASAWVLVPDTSSAEPGKVRARVIDGWDSPRALRGVWQRTEGGYSLRVRIPFTTSEAAMHEFALGVVVNEKPPERDRRRGQLVRVTAESS
jgi:hypothetical protein